MLFIATSGTFYLILIATPAASFNHLPNFFLGYQSLNHSPYTTRPLTSTTKTEELLTTVVGRITNTFQKHNNYNTIFAVHMCLKIYFK